MLDYGLEGYGLYWYCIELIAGKVDKENITFELEHDARVIARNTGCTAQKVEEMMRYFVDIGLFENSQGVVTCLKLAKRLDKSMTSNPEMRSIIEQLKSHDSIMTPSAKPMQDKIRLEEIRLDKNKDICADEPAKKVRQVKPDSFKSFFAKYPAHRKGGTDSTAWAKWKSLKITEDDALLINEWVSKAVNVAGWESSDYVPGITKFLTEKRWLSPLPTSKNKVNDISTIEYTQGGF